MAIQDDNTILNKGDLKAYHQKILPYLGSNIMMATNVSDNYSTEEKIIGTWIDGKPLYQKTLKLRTPIQDGDLFISDTPIGSQVETVADSKSMMVGSNGFFPIASYMFQGTILNGGSLTDAAKVRIQINDNNHYSRNTVRLVVTTSAYANDFEYYATICYTKTTDAAGSGVSTPGAYDLNRPDLWPENTEINFGGGLYGQRFTGTFSSNGSPKDLGVTVDRIIDEGGQMNFPGWVNAPVPHAVPSDTSDYWGMVFQGLNNMNLHINGSCYGGPKTVTYDVWVTYKK